MTERKKSAPMFCVAHCALRKVRSIKLDKFLVSHHRPELTLPVHFVYPPALGFWGYILFNEVAYGNEFLGGYNNLNKFISTEKWRSLPKGRSLPARLRWEAKPTAPLLNVRVGNNGFVCVETLPRLTGSLRYPINYRHVIKSLAATWDGWSQKNLVNPDLKASRYPRGEYNGYVCLSTA